MKNEALEKADNVLKQILVSPAGLAGVLLTLFVLSVIGREWYLGIENAKARRDQADALTRMANNEEKESGEILRILQKQADNTAQFLQEERAERESAQAYIKVLQELLKAREKEKPCG